MGILFSEWDVQFPPFKHKAIKNSSTAHTTVYPHAYHLENSGNQRYHATIDSRMHARGSFVKSNRPKTSYFYYLRFSSTFHTKHDHHWASNRLRIHTVYIFRNNYNARLWVAPHIPKNTLKLWIKFFLFTCFCVCSLKPLHFVKFRYD